MIEIQKLTAETKPLFYQADDRRLDSEDVAIRVNKNGFSLEYRPKPNALWRVTTREEAQDEQLPGEGYLAFLDGESAGRMLLCPGEHRLLYADRLCVPLALRRKGVGRAMLAFAEDWARRYGFSAVCVETQDSNAGACQFLTRCGYQLGGIDALRYVCASQEMRKAPALRETALFFYKML